VRDPGRQQPDRSHLFGLDQLSFTFFKLIKGFFQRLIGGIEFGGSFFNFFLNNKNLNNQKSIFVQKRGQIITKRPSSVIVDQAEICQTPIIVSMHNKKLKIVVARLHKIEE